MKLVVVAVGGLLLCSLAHAQKPEPTPDMDKLLDKLTFTKDKASLPYRLLKPDGYDKDGKDRYPLVVFLHGTVGRGTDNKKQLRSGVEEVCRGGRVTLRWGSRGPLRGRRRRGAAAPISADASPTRRRPGRCGSCGGRKPCASRRCRRSSPRRGPR